MTKIEAAKLNPLGNFAVTMTGIAGLFYTTLLSKIVWGWFMVDKLFEVNYWEMFLGILIVRFIFGTNNAGMLSMRINEKLGKESTSKRITRIVGNYLGMTMLFGIFFIVKLIISYYS